MSALIRDNSVRRCFLSVALPQCEGLPIVRSLCEFTAVTGIILSRHLVAEV